MSVPPSDDPTPRNGSTDDGSIGDVLEYVKAYTEQQTIGGGTGWVRLAERPLMQGK